MSLEGDSMGLGRLERVDPRSIWLHEARDLTPWLKDNLDVLAQALGTDIVATQREVAVGDFSLDLLGEDSSGRVVIIENQIEPTDHSHLGQLIVYASGLEAGLVVWLTTRFREEHRRAIDWLNERTDEKVHFFGVEIDLVRIGGSSPAPLVRVVARPNDWQKAVRRATGISDLAENRHAFVEKVMEGLSTRPGFRPRKVGYDNWLSMASGPFGYYAISFAQGGRLRTEVYLDTGVKETTKALFDSLFVQKVELETTFGQPLSWERLDDRRASRIAAYTEAPDFSDDEAVSETIRWATHKIARFMDVFDTLLRSRTTAGHGPGVGSKPSEMEQNHGSE